MHTKYEHFKKQQMGKKYIKEIKKNKESKEGYTVLNLSFSECYRGWLGIKYLLALIEFIKTTASGDHNKNRYILMEQAFDNVCLYITLL